MATAASAPHSLTRRALALAGIVTASWIVVAGGALGLCALARAAFGCRIDEGSAHACMVAGVDAGAALYAIGMVGLLGVFALPLALVVVAGSLATALAAWVAGRLRRKG